MYLPKRNYVNSSWKITFLFWVDNNSIHKWKFIFISKLLQIIWVAKNKKYFFKVEFTSLKRNLAQMW